MLPTWWRRASPRAQPSDEASAAHHHTRRRHESPWVNILLLAPHPFFQVRGTPLAVRTVLEFLSARGHSVDVLTFHEGEDVVLPNCRMYRIARLPGIRNIRPGFSFEKVICDGLMLVECVAADQAEPIRSGPCRGGVGLHRGRHPGRDPHSLRLRHGLVPVRADGERVPGAPLGRCGPPALRGFRDPPQPGCADRVRRARQHRARARAEKADRTSRGHDPPALDRAVGGWRRRRACGDCRSRSRGDVRRQPRAVSGHRSAARRLPLRPPVGAQRAAGHRRWPGRGHRTLPREVDLGGER